MVRTHSLRKRIMILSACALIGSNAFAGSNLMTAYAVTLGSGSQSYRINVLSAIGAADESYESDEACSRADFAKLLVLSSTYKNTADTLLSSAAANDVPASYTGAQYIKTALINGWMRTRLGGNFAPDQAVTLNDAAKAAVTILGYTDEDFSSNVSQERLSLFKSLDLNEGINAVNGTDTLSKKDAINVIYNLLKTNTKSSGSIYGTAIDLTLDSDGELNATNVIENSLVGPALVKSMDELRAVLPFDMDSNVTYYLNGQNSGQYGKMYLESQIRSNGWVIVYYNENSKTIWAYGSDTGNNTYHCIQGKVTSIIYEDDNIAAPSAVYIDSIKYTLNSSDVKFMFSLNGDIGVGDYCVLICKDNSDALADDSEATDYYAVAVVKWNRNTDGSTIGTIIAENAGYYTNNSNTGTNTDTGSTSSE